MAICAISITLSATFDNDAEAVNFLDYPAGAERKQAFISFLRPLIEEYNQTLLHDREKLTRLRQKAKLNIREQRWLKHISQNYDNASFDADSDADWSRLINKVDLIPTSLAIAQGAMESGWGSSRFSRQGNNYFGQWCYQSGCGLIPKNRNDSARHEVAKYESAQDSVISYINNLNKHSAYKELRAIRGQLREANQVITGHHLAKGLQHYSERGQVYVEEIQALIRNNKLQTSI